MTLSELYQISYISKNTVLGTPEQLKAQIEDILKKAQKNNSILNISGALLYSGGYFCQVIEGEQNDIEKLFKRIQMDSRHSDITVLCSDFVVKRCFSNWGMAFAGIEDTMRFDIDGVKNSKDGLMMKETGKNMINVLEDLIKHQEIIFSVKGSLKSIIS
jgi:hypothetical protein